jgi:hypothetical protein
LTLVKCVSVSAASPCPWQATGDDLLVLAREKVNTELLQGAASIMAEMLSNPFFGAL